METLTWIGVALAGVTMLSNGWDRWVRYKEKALESSAVMAAMRVELEECKKDRADLRAEIEAIKKKLGE